MTSSGVGHKIEVINLAESGLKPHSCISHIPRWSDDDPRALAIRARLFSGDELAPINVTTHHEIIDPDSRERWRAAKLAGVEMVTVQIHAEADVELACINALVLRRHLTKSALAYLTFPLMRPAFDSIRAKQLDQVHENLKKSQQNAQASAQRTLGSAEALADQIGIGRTCFFDAKKVHELFARDAEYKALMEPRILAEPIGGEHEDKRPVGLGAVIAGWAGRKNLNQPRRENQLGLFVSGWGAVFKRFSYWLEMDTAARREALAKLRKEWESLPDDQRKEIATVMRDIGNELAGGK